MNQYKWDGTEALSSIFSYSHQLGPRDTLATGVSTLAFSIEDAKHIIQLYRHTFPSVLIPEPDYDIQVDTIRNDLISKIDMFLSTLAPNGRWFLKTNRHSCKDSPLDHPLETDIELFASVLSEVEVPPMHLNIDNIDFGPCFEAMCVARLQATSISDGASTVSLLERSKRIHDDLSLQLELCPDPWDCYLAFSPFDDDMTRYPTHEFRCFVSRRKLRCITQYSYLIKCPIPADLIPVAVQAISSCIEEEVLPALDNAIRDAAVDVQCVPVAGGQKSHPVFTVRVIEINPLGPGTVWGHLEWEKDKQWLLSGDVMVAIDGCTRQDQEKSTNIPSANTESVTNTDTIRRRCILPMPSRYDDSAGGQKTIDWYGMECSEGQQLSRQYRKIDQSECRGYSSGDGDGYYSNLPYQQVVVVLYTSLHPIGLNSGALAHMPSAYLLVVWSAWRMEERPSPDSPHDTLHTGDVNNYNRFWDFLGNMTNICIIS